MAAPLLLSNRSEGVEQMVAAPEIRHGTASSEQATVQTEATNTLIVTNVPSGLLHPAVTPSLREFFERFGRVEAWVPLLSFERVVVVYRDVHSAEEAKNGMDHTLVEGFASGGSSPASPSSASSDQPRWARARTHRSAASCKLLSIFVWIFTHRSSSILRVYRGRYTHPDSLPDGRHSHHLEVPASDKNFLISPPGSPPVGWEQIREDPPNLDTLADDLARALSSLSALQDREGAVGDSTESGTHDATTDGSLSSLGRSGPASPRDTLIIPHRRTESGDLPSVMVSDLDAGQQEGGDGERGGLSIADAFSIQRRSSAGSISRVKATVESMQGSFEFHPTGPRIDRTPRPPLA